mgnify:CR=1 FL=1
MYDARLERRGAKVFSSWSSDKHVLCVLCVMSENDIDYCKVDYEEPFAISKLSQ